MSSVEPTANNADAVAHFAEGRRSPLRRLQHLLHQYPTIVPFVVLVVGLLIFSAIVGRASSSRSTCR